MIVKACETYPVVILAGGQNSRMQALSGTIYKPFLPLQGMTLVARHIMRTALAGSTDITVLIDSPDPLISAHVEATAASLPASVALSVAHVSGDTAEKLRTYRLNRGKDLTFPVIIVLGDSFALYDPNALGRAASGSADSAVAIAKYHIPYGVVGVEDGMVKHFHEKPYSGYLINAGQLALGAEAFELMDRGLDLARVLSCLATSNRLAAVEVASSLLSVDSLGDIAEASISPLLATDR